MLREGVESGMRPRRATTGRTPRDPLHISEAERPSFLEALAEPLIESPALAQLHRRFASSTQIRG